MGFKGGEQRHPLGLEMGGAGEELRAQIVRGAVGSSRRVTRGQQ